MEAFDDIIVFDQNAVSYLELLKVPYTGCNPRGLTLSRDLSLPRGRHGVAWKPPGRGRYRLRIVARGPSGPAGVASKTIQVKLPKPKPKHKKKRPRDDARRAVTRP